MLSCTKAAHGRAVSDHLSCTMGSSGGEDNDGMLRQSSMSAGLAGTISALKEAVQSSQYIPLWSQLLGPQEVT